MDFEQSFGEFIDCREYDEAERALFDMVRLAFKAGWKAAGGKEQPEKKSLHDE